MVISVPHNLHCVIKCFSRSAPVVSKFNLVGPDEEYNDSVLESYKEKIGEPITAMVVDVNPQTQKLNLSIREMIKRNQESEMAKYMADDKEDEDTYNPFAALMGKKDDKENN